MVSVEATIPNKISQAPAAPVMAAVPSFNSEAVRSDLTNLSASQASSFDSMEGVPEHVQEPKVVPEPSKSELVLSTSPVYKFVREKLPVYGCSLASAMHFFAAFGKFLPSGLTKFVDKYAIYATKIFNCVNYTLKGAEALINKRTWDAFGRLLYPLIIPFVPDKHVYVVSGLSSGTTMFYQGQMPKIKDESAYLGSFLNNCKAFKETLKETLQAGFGKNRKIFLPYAKEVAAGGVHTMHFSAFGNFIGGILGSIAVLAEKTKIGVSLVESLPYRIVKLFMRHAGSAGCDWAKITHPDLDNRICGYAYLVVSFFDILQNFTKGKLSRALNHMSLAVNNVANFFYVNTSKTITDGTYKEVPKDLAA